ncbi:glycoside hydrolase family 3 protein [Dacryopinax primogenitus]|uniref:Glycoside hydrolase family 3 protein n=1 Tax=Dacryopinax primogenitus (strain DJM 731) TaxID=1858805 RepID=M5FTN4_DACPD|nr:glycoside hydrolase family 3 protein [Dacryopinax primogenitus]EJT98774.1 glycoside hydrolase family 3 protein [Dacryopinax primogenitus]
MLATVLGCLVCAALGSLATDEIPLYKDPNAPIDARVTDLLGRMSVEDKVSQLIQGDIDGWMNMSDPLDNTLVYNATGLVEMMATKSGVIWAGYQMPYEKSIFAVTVGHKYLMENTTLGIPALIQSESLHGFTNNGTIFPSSIGMACSFNTDLMYEVAKAIGGEAEGLGFSMLFAPVLDLSRELRWGRVEENYGEDPFLTGEMGYAYVTGLQAGTRRNVSSTASARLAATCKHFAAFGSPQGGLNLAPVSGGERELRTTYLKPFYRACVQGIMSAYSSYDGIPAVANSHLLTEILRDEWDYQGFATTDAGSVDLLITEHGVASDRAAAAKLALENGLSGEMGGGSYTYLTLPESIANGSVGIGYLDKAVSYLLKTKFELGLFENPYPYPDYATTIRTPSTRHLLHQIERESIVLLKNDGVLPLQKGGSVALIGPSAGQVLGNSDYVFFNASLNGISPLQGLTDFLSGSNTTINYAEGCKLWSNDESGFPAALEAAEQSDVAVVVIGTWSRDQTLLWQGLNATTGEHVDLSSLSLVGAQLRLVQAVRKVARKLVVVFVSGKPVAEPWVKAWAEGVVQQFYPGELGGTALAEVLYGAYNPSGRLSVSVPQNVGTLPAFCNYLKGGRPVDPGFITPNGSLVFGHQYVLSTPLPLWSFGHGLSYSTFHYTALSLSHSQLQVSDTHTHLGVNVTLTNVGPWEGAEVVQVYLVIGVSGVVTPNQELAAFRKAFFAVGETRTLNLEIRMEDLPIWVKGWVWEKGEYVLRAGTSKNVYLNASFVVG